MSDSTKPAKNLKNRQREFLEQETHDRNTINDYYQAVKDNEKILIELGLYEEIKACQRALIGLPMCPINFMPGFANQCDVTDYLPESLRCVVLYLSAKTGFDRLTCTMAVVLVIAIALCGRFRIELDPGWREAVLLYFMMIAESGENKDSLINMVRQPLDEAMNELQADYDNSAPQKQLKNKTRKAAFEGGLRADINRITKACCDPKLGIIDYDKLMKDADQISEQAGAARQKLSSEALGARPNLRFSNVTEQGLISILAKQGGFQAVIEAEAGFIKKILKLGARFNIDTLLLGYEQSDYLPGNARDQAHLLKISLIFLLGAQPIIGSQFFRKFADEERGLAPRFIPMFPHKSVIPATSRDYSSQFQFFSEKVKSILKYNFTQDLHREIKTLGVTSEAHARLKEFRGHNRALIKDGYEHMAAYLRKLHGKACRIAGVLHLWECFVNGTITNVISDQAIDAGIAIAKASIPHADHAFSPAGLIGVDPADRILRWVGKARMMSFDYSTVKKAIDSELNGELINAGLQRLVSCRVLGIIHDHKGLPVYVVNPSLCGWFTPPVIAPPMTPPTVPLALPPSQQSNFWEFSGR